MRASVSSNMGLSMPETLPCLRSKSLIPAYNTGMGCIIALSNTVCTGRDLSVQYDRPTDYDRIYLYALFSGSTSLPYNIAYLWKCSLGHSSDRKLMMGQLASFA